MFGLAKKTEVVPGSRTTSVICHQTEMLPTLPDPPERPQRTPKWLTRRELAQYLSVDDARLESLFGLGDPIRFPAAGRRAVGDRVQLVWTDVQVDDWLVRAHTYALRLNELLPEVRR